MQNTVAITRDVPDSFAGDCALTFLAREPIDTVEARRQHAAYRAALHDAGCTVVNLPAGAGMPDAVFVEDAAIVLRDVAVMARPALATRLAEVAAVAHALAPYRAPAFIQPPATLEGGDVLVIGRRIFVGLSSRTNRAGFDQLAGIATPHGYDVADVAVPACLHLKTAVTALDGETVVINPRWLDAAAFSEFRQIETPPDETFAANTLSAGGIVHVSKRWPRTASLIEAAGYRTRPLDICEFEKAEGGLTCLSLIV